MNDKLKDIYGTPIRKQYFNIPICLLLLANFIYCGMVIFSAVFDKQFEFQKCINDIGAFTFDIAIFVLPLVILSLLNRRLFGKTVGVIINRELHYKDGVINLEDIISVNYHFTEIGTFHYRPACVEVVCKNNTAEIFSAPISTLFIIKKINPKIKTNYDKTIWIAPIITAVVCFVISVL